MEVLVFFKDPDANTTEHIAQLEHKHQWPQVEACKTDGAHGCFNAPMLVCDPSDGLCSGPDLARHLQIGRLALIFTGSSSQLPIVEEPRSTFNRFFMMLLWGLVGAWGALGAPQFGWPTTFESNGQDCGPQLFQTHMGRHKQTRQSKVEAWQRHAYLVGTSHKAGTEMLHNTMRRAFDVLGGMDSCNYDRGGGPITSVAPKHQDCHLHPARIRYTHHMSGDDLRELRGLTSGAGGFRGVMMIRDPLDMIISSYVYHHRGAEADTELGVNMTEMSPEVGIPEMADRMYAVLSPMVDAYKVMKPDMMAARFEDFTRSSKSFNRTVEEFWNRSLLENL